MFRSLNDTLPSGMKVVPYGTPGMTVLFKTYAAILLTRNDYLDAFEADTGLALSECSKWSAEQWNEAHIKWFDWVAANHWNVDPRKQ